MGFGLLERARELDAVDVLLTEAAAGSGGALVLSGSSGIGKSALVREAVRRGRAAGFRTLSVRLDELDGSVPFGVVGDLLASELAGLDATTASPLARRALEALGRNGGDDARSSHEGDFTASSVRHALYWLIAGLADRQPLLFAVDDAHWSDVASLRFLGHLVRRIDGLPVALVAATRRPDEGLAEEVIKQLGEGHRVLAPQPLSADAAATMARAAFADTELSEALSDALHAATAGNPLALRELLAALVDADVDPAEATPELIRKLGSRALAQRVQQRLERVSADAVELARALAVVGDIGSIEAVGALVGIAPDKVARAAEELVGMDLVHLGATCRFGHTLLREAVRNDVAIERRDELSRLAARFLADDSQEMAAAAQLLTLSPAEDTWVVDVLLRAATVSVDRGAPEVAEPLLHRALREPPGARQSMAVWSTLGRAQLALGDPSAVGSLEEALRHAPDPRSRGLVARDLAEALVHVVRVGEAAEVLRRATAELRVAAATPEDLALADELEMQLLMSATWDPALRWCIVEHLARESELPERPDGFAREMDLILRALESVASCAPAAEGIALIDRALATGTLARRSPEVALAGVVLLAICGQPQRARPHLESSIARARDAGSLPQLRAGIGLRGQISMLEGDVLAAETDGWAMQDLSEEGEVGTPYLLGFLTEALLAQGRVDEAADGLQRAGLMGPLPDLGPLNTILCARARVRAARGDLYAALADLQACGERQERLGQRNPALNPWRAVTVEVLGRLGRHDDAVDLADDDLALSRRFGAAHVVGAALRSRALAGPDPDLALLEEARTILSRSPARLTLAQVHHDIGTALLARGDRAAAREAFSRAADLARQLSAAFLAEQATAGVIAAGGRPRRTPARGAESLTPSERRVAELAVTGAMNREIAQALFVTEKTVETHLRNSFRKLGVGSRTQLAAALGEH